jgi:hypothetical protein
LNIKLWKPCIVSSEFVDEPLEFSLIMFGFCFGQGPVIIHQKKTFLPMIL